MRCSLRRFHGRDAHVPHRGRAARRQSLDMQGSAWTMRGHIKLAMARCWPDVGAAVAVEVRTRAQRTRPLWERMGRVLKGSLPASPSSHIARAAAHDDRWPGAPMAVLLTASLGEDVVVGEAYREVARIPESVRRRSKRARCESMVTESLAPTCIEAIEEPSPPVDHEHIHRVWDLNSKLSSTSHRTHDAVRDKCLCGCDIVDSLDNQVECFHLRGGCLDVR